MNAYSEIMRCENQRLAGGVCGDDDRCECPVCGSRCWDYLICNYQTDIVGCTDCVSRMYPEEFASEADI